jgi:hypothetical protein
MSRNLEDEAALIGLIDRPAHTAESTAAGALSDTDTRKRLETLQQVADALSCPVPDLEGIDMTARVRQAIAARTRRKPPPRFALVWAPTLAAAAAACVWLFVSWQPRNESETEFRARSAGSQLSEEERWTGIRVYRARSKTGPAERVVAEIDAHDALVFSYVNRSPSPYAHLMVFALGADGREYWFYPAHDSASHDDASSIEISPQSELSLHELVSNDYAPGTLQLFALFTHTALWTSQVSAWLREHPDGLENVVPHDARLQVLQFSVTGE